MKIDKTHMMVALAALVIVVGGVFWLSRDAGDSKAADSESLSIKSRKISESKVWKEKRRARKESRSGQKVAVQRVKPQVLDLEDDEEAKLNEYSRKILRDLQAALDSNNFKRVSKLVAKMLEIPPDPKFGKEGVASLLRRKAVEALGWFGAQSLPELTALLADPDAQVEEAAFEQFRLALEDTSLGDRAAADIIYMAAKVLTNADQLEMLFMEVNNMRHSVGAGVLCQIALDGTDAAKAQMPEAIEFFTGEDNIMTVEDLQAWLDQNPDSPDDEDLYGPDKD